MDTLQVLSFPLSILGVILIYFTLKKAGDSLSGTLTWTIIILIPIVANFLFMYFNDSIKNSNWSYSQLAITLLIFLLVYGTYRARIQDKKIISGLMIFILVSLLIIPIISGFIYLFIILI